MVKDPTSAVTRAGTIANARHLAPAFFDAVIARYHGTRLGRQELDGEIIEERADALWSRGLIESCRVEAPPPLARVVVAVDPPASSGKGADACGLVEAGLAEDGSLYVSFAFIILHALWSGHEVGINGFANLSSLLMAYFGVRFGVLGVYVSGRSLEKQACATGQLAPSVLDQVVKAVVKKK